MSGSSSEIINKTQIKVGAMAPMFRFKDECGEVLSLSDLKGKKVVLFFYPKDLTLGCTREACSLRDRYDELLKHNIYIIGISADDQKRHDRFISKHELPFPLIADTSKQIIRDYNVWGKKQFLGLEFDGIKRTTFIIDENGRIEQIITKVNTGQHANQILAIINP